MGSGINESPGDLWARSTNSFNETLSETRMLNERQQSWHNQHSLLESTFGSFNESRLAFPEYASGAVPRLYSSLQYSYNRDTKHNASTSALHAPGSVVSAVALITGTTVGAGILALPTATAAAGFLPSTLAMVAAWFLLTTSGLLLSELVLNRLGNTGKPTSTGLLTLYTTSAVTTTVARKMSREPNWTHLTGTLSILSYFFYHYALMVAYLAQGGVTIHQWLPPHADNSVGTASVGLTVVLAATIYSTKKNHMQQINNALVVGVFAAFAATVLHGAQTAEYFPELVDPIHQHYDSILPALPVIFLAFVYQNIVPVIVKDLEGDRRKIAQAIVGGTTIPLFMFVAWNAVILAHVAPGTDISNINPVSLLQTSNGNNDDSILSLLVASFSLLAITTSLIGFVYGLLDAWTDVIQLKESDGASTRWKLPLFGLIFLPPLAFALANPNVFQTALEYGGAFGVSTLFMILPAILVWQERYGPDQSSELMTTPLVPLGKIPLLALLVAAAIVIVEQICNMMRMQTG
jgi:tyrosine-specific transport protein